MKFTISLCFPAYCGNGDGVKRDGGERPPPREEVQVAQEYGWICPRCGKSLAPWVRQCDCLAAAGDPLMPVPGDPLPRIDINFEDDSSLSAVLRKVRRHEQDAKKVAV